MNNILIIYTQGSYSNLYIFDLTVMIFDGLESNYKKSGSIVRTNGLLPPERDTTVIARGALFLSFMKEGNH